MIFAEDLTKDFDGFVAVNGVNLEVFPGEVLILLGPNGAGKTTTVRMLTSILTPTCGHATVAGYDVVRQADKVRASVGVLTEQTGLYGRMNAPDYLLFYGRLYGMDVQACRVRINELLEKFGLAEAGRKRLGEYSKGMRQKLALVRALLHNPPVLLLDEPTSAMDPESARLVRDSIRSLRDKDRTVLLCTHNLVEAEELADKVAFIRRGQIILNDTLANLKLKLLGPVEYEANLAQPVEGWSSSLPEGVSLTSSGPSSLRFRVQNPQVSNPILIHQMVDAHLDVISFQEVPHTLEQAYLAANTHLSELEKTNRV